MKGTKTKFKMDAYVRRYVMALKTAHIDEELTNIVNKIYEDGFEDGAKEG